MFSPLSILYLVLPFPLAFILHDAEEVAVQHRWLLAHRQQLIVRFPRMRTAVEHLCSLGTKGFAIAAAEELAVLLIATCYVLVGAPFCMPIWTALFMAFSLHLLVHVAQALLVRGYVPGFASSLLLLPFSAYGVWSLWLATDTLQLVACSIAGCVFVAANLRFAHWLGTKLSKT